MKKTLLLVFIHGFKASRNSILSKRFMADCLQGGDNTFEKFPEHLRVLVSHKLPKLNVISAVYPQYETRGDLRSCVAKFKEWYARADDFRLIQTDHCMQAREQSH